MFRKPLFIAGLGLALTACSSSPSGGAKLSTASEQETPRPTETQTGRAAFQRLYTTSRGWAPDTEPIRLESQNWKRSEGKPEDSPLGHDGKSGMWRGLFGSPSRRMMKTYMWSGLGGPDAPNPGINPGAEDSFSPDNTSTEPFQVVYLKYDSPQAFDVAQKHGGAALLKKEPDLPVNYTLAWDRRRGGLEWHVIYGKSTNDPKLDVIVNAASGEFVAVEK